MKDLKYVRLNQQQYMIGVVIHEEDGNVHFAPCDKNKTKSSLKEVHVIPETALFDSLEELQKSVDKSETEVVEPAKQEQDSEPS